MSDVRKVRLREFGRIQSKDEPQIDTLRFGKGCVLFSFVDITSGLLGTSTRGIAGFDPAYSTKLMSNLVIWSADRQ